MKAAGILHSSGGKVRLLNGPSIQRLGCKSGRTSTVWEALHQLIRAAQTRRRIRFWCTPRRTRGKTEAVRQLAYRLYTLCERLGLSEDARAYNELITKLDWHRIRRQLTSVAYHSKIFDVISTLDGWRRIRCQSSL